MDGERSIEEVHAAEEAARGAVGAAQRAREALLGKAMEESRKIVEDAESAAAELRAKKLVELEAELERARKEHAALAAKMHETAAKTRCSKTAAKQIVKALLREILGA